MKDKKGSRRFDDILVEVNEMNVHSKWLPELGEIINRTGAITTLLLNKRAIVALLSSL